MAINPILPILIGAIKTRNTIKDRNDDLYDEATGNFIDIASAEFFRDQTEQKKRIDTNKKERNTSITQFFKAIKKNKETA